MSPLPRACFFDLDGTLVDTEFTWAQAMSAYLADRGEVFSTREILKLVYGRSWFEIHHDLATKFPAAFDRPVELITQELRAYYRRICTDPRANIIAPSVACLRRVAQYASCAIVSGSSHQDIELAVELIECQREVKAVFGAEDYARGKPAPDGFLAAAAHFKVDPSACVVFEDSPAGIQAAKSAGMYCVALDRTGTNAYARAHADRVLSTLADY